MKLPWRVWQPLEVPPSAIRRATVDDALEIAEVWLRSRRAAIPAIPPPVHTDDEVKSYFRQVVVPNMDTWVVERDDRIAALLVLDREWVEQLYVDPGCTDQGLGSELIELAKKERPEGLELWTFQANTGARRFYERHGFSAVAETEGDNEEGAPDVRYRWPAA